ncbi:MAG: hypothetical protein JJU42_11830 [Rhodobacteraceae bacterium]|nr:hypothetical protein [Paracoccaceae bacterium]
MAPDRRNAPLRRRAAGAPLVASLGAPLGAALVAAVVAALVATLAAPPAQAQRAAPQEAPGRPLEAPFANPMTTGLDGPGARRDDDPLSAIDWLSDSFTALPAFPDRGGSDSPAASDGIRDERIEVHVLGADGAEVVGLFPAERVGLRRDFWGATPAAEIAARLRALRTDTLPVAQTLILRILLAEFDPPLTAPVEATMQPPAPDLEGRRAPGDDPLLLARIDTLRSFGAVEQAMQLAESGARMTPPLWQRWFDLALLLGDEERACAALEGQPRLGPGDAARIYCLARQGDWAAAMLGLQTARTLGGLDPVDAALLARFLDAEDADRAGADPVPQIETPLQWRILEAVGEPVYTNALPVAFAHADLRGTAGWRAQIEAAERLTRTGALEPNRLLGLYTGARAAASGGIWDRVRAVEVFERALESGDAAAIGPALERLWQQAQAAELETAFAALFGPRLAGAELSGAAQQIAFDMALLGPDPVAAAEGPRPEGARAAFLAAIVTGHPAPDLAAQVQNRATAEAIAAALAPTNAADAPVPDTMAARIAQGHHGDTVLAALERLADGAAGDLRALTDALATLRALGLENVARRAALEAMILQRTG